MAGTLWEGTVKDPNDEDTLDMFENDVFQCPGCGDVVHDENDLCSACAQDHFDEWVDSWVKKKGWDDAEPPEISGKGWGLEVER